MRGLKIRHQNLKDRWVMNSLRYDLVSYKNRINICTCVYNKDISTS